MGNPSAAIAVAEAPGARLAALLAAIEGSSAGERVGHANIPPTLEDPASWDAVPVEITRDVGVYIATLDASADAMVEKWTFLFEMGLGVGQGASVGILRVAVATFHGLKVAKRWDVLQLASLSVVDRVTEAIQQRLEDDETVLAVLVGLYAAILLGFQHSGELFARTHDKIVALAPLISAVGHESLSHRFVVMAAALVHCHRAYEAEAAAVRAAVEDAFGEELARRPVVECETALREAAWVLPAAALNKYLPTIEGKWVQDEFSSEQHASAATAPQNAGSITLKKVANVVAFDFHATVDDVRSKTQMQLDGALFRPLADASRWQLEGHWSQVLAAASTNGAVATATVAVKPEPWTCPACTLSNDGSASKCATCGTDAPKNASSQTTKAGGKTTNPAPFQAVFDADHTFMRIRWSRGEQSGVWLARKEESSVKFDLAESLLEVSSTAMVDSNAISANAYSPRGDPARVLMLEKSYSLSTYGEMTVELWIQVEAGIDEQAKQTILASGEFEFSYQPSCQGLVWDVGSGIHVITASSSSVSDGAFHHVVLLFGKTQLQILVDGLVAGSVERGLPDQASVPSRRSNWLSIGGCVSDDGERMESVFQGVLVDLRVWSDLGTHSLFTSAEALNGSESGLIGYFPLVGDSHRLLVDASKHDNHATVFATEATSAFVGTRFCPSAVVDKLPVAKSFSSSVGGFDISGVTELGGSTVDGSATLRLIHPSAVWHDSPVSIAGGFRTMLAVDKSELATSHSEQVVFALCEASYWDASPLISEAASLGLPFDAEPNKHRYSGSALFVAFDRAVSAASTSQVATVSVYVWKDRRSLQLCRLSSLPISAGSQTGLVVTYVRASHVLNVEVVGSGATMEIAIDIESALELRSEQLRTGIVATSTLQPNLSAAALPCTTVLTSWTFEGLAQGRDDASSLHKVYPRLRHAGQAGGGNTVEDSSDNSAVDTIACTRSTSDGSAIEQPTYGCQTCGVVHGAGLCAICVAICHEGHELVYMGSMITACACTMRSAGQCKCATPVPVSDYPNVDRTAPRASQWYCNRCTVVNASGVRECTVCANSAPEPSVLGLVPATNDNVPESTSRALVPIFPTESTPAVLPREWSCPACTYLNIGDAGKCIICDTARPTSGQDEPKSGSDGLLTLYNAAESQQTQAVATPALTSWYCGACTMENKPSDGTCFMCQTTREVPVVEPVGTAEVRVQVPPAITDVIPMATPVEMDSPSVDSIAPSASSGVIASRTLAQFLLREAIGDSGDSSSNVTALGVVWDSTVGPLTISIETKPVVAQYVEGQYVEKDGFLRGLAQLAGEEQSQWKFSGRFKKLSQSQENAVLLTWEKDMTRFSGKWFRGDGSGEWKCVAAPLVNDFRGLAPVDATKANSSIQPFYSGLINMKQNLTNVCYQNSFLQSLFITQAFRRLILSSKLEDYMHMPMDTGSGNQGDVLKSVQDLFARLIASQRPELDSHMLQRCLPSTFQAGRQQDTSDFAHFLIDSLSQQLNQHQNTAHGVDDVFGGTQATILACKTCGKRSVKREYFWEMLVNMIDLRYTPITSISAVTGVSTEIPTPADHERINSDLNKDRNGAPYVYLCVKRKPEASSIVSEILNAELPITDLVVKVVGFADAKPVLEGYERVELDLNVGGSTVVIGGKKQVYLFFRRELNGSPITDLQIIYGNEAVPDGFKKIGVDLNQGEGTKVFLCYRCDMPITDMKIVNSGIPGYRMVDHVLNRSNEDSVKQYLAFKVGGSEPCITDLKLVPATEKAQYHEEGWETLGSPSSTLEEGTIPELLLVRRGHGNPIFAVDVFRAPRQVPRYNDYEVIDMYGAQTADAVVTAESVAAALKGDWLADEAVDRGRKAVRIQTVSDPIQDALIIKGSFEDKGEVNAVATPTSSSWSVASSADSTASKRVLRVSGYWKNSKAKQAQLFDVELRPGVGDSSDAYTLSGTIGDGRGRPIAVTGTQTSRSVRIKWPISQILVLRGDERVPEGVEVVRETCSGKTGNLLAQTQSPHTLYLAVKREESPQDGSIGDVCVIYGEIDAIPENYTCIQATPSGHSANLNDGTTGVPIFICYRRVTAETENCLMDLALMWTSGAQADALPAGFTKIQHTPLGMEANLNQGTTGVSIHLCFAKCNPSDVVRPMDDPLNGEYEIVTAPSPGSTPTTTLPLIGKFIRLSVAERVDTAYTLEGKFGTVFHGYQPGMMRGTLYTSSQRKKRVVTGVWMSDEQNASSMIDFVPPSFPFEWTLNEASNEFDGWWSGADDASSISYITTPSPATTTTTSSSSVATATPNLWKLMKDAYVRIAFKKDYGTEWKNGQLVSSERVWRHDVESMLSRLVSCRTLGGDNLLSCSQCDRKTESRTNTVVVAPPAHLILTMKRMFYDWAQQKTRKCLHDVTFPALLTLPALTTDDEAALSSEDSEIKMRLEDAHRQYGLYGVLVHSGLTANSGHYFSFCRESDDSTKQLHQEDSPLAPWIKFNDSKVESSSWAEINRAVSSSVSDTVYLLLYKRLSYTPPREDAMDVEHTDDDEDEAMLLAKAMALSMSAANQKKLEETKRVATAALEGETKAESGEASEAPQVAVIAAPRRIDSAVFKEVEAANTQFLFDMMQTAASAVHVQDLHALLGLQFGLLHDDASGMQQ